ncbi:endonuclease 8-like 1 isoform X1 [Hemibagrus wyckioides]|uniref:endonuclease 8-like 1 isoform X1 n=1 Tax=Hemibagrus wyckioides TaxID=337641 RepID=UPI00266DA9BD|nr:endonuclease 8-like 1 isoform X1 [Hemibagrus wyckioides]
MPEGPELHLASVFVNTACAGVIFSGSVEKSEVSKGAEVHFNSEAYQIRATSRGKEVRLTLTPIKTDQRKDSKSGLNQAPMDVVFRFGMSGNFTFTTKSDLPKHAHLRFYTKEDPQRVLSFVDVRRFGSWQPDGHWQKDRGPCVMLEYKSFRENVLSNLSDKAFDRPVCEALLNQKYFNGIGNYLRAEILYRLKIPPFVKARTVLEELKPQYEETMNIKEEPGTDVEEKAGVDEKKTESQDLLSLCHTVPLEVVNLGGKGYDPQKRDYTELMSWMQCYSVDGMNSLRDHNGRTIWFKDVPGPMAPKGFKSSKAKRKIKKDVYTDTGKEKLVKKEAGAGKRVKDVAKKQSGARRQNASKTGAGAEADRKRPNTRSSTGDCHHIVVIRFSLVIAVPPFVIKSLVLFRATTNQS